MISVHVLDVPAAGESWDNDDPPWRACCSNGGFGFVMGVPHFIYFSMGFSHGNHPASLGGIPQNWNQMDWNGDL